MKINLIIQRKWFDEIRQGTKKKEFRDITERLASKICDFDHAGNLTGFKPIKQIVFLNGYRKDRAEMTVECVGVDFHPENDWFVFFLGEVVSVKNC